MRPSQVSAELKKIAFDIERCKKSVRPDLVSRDLRRILAAMEIDWEKKISDHINEGADAVVLFQAAIDQNVNGPAAQHGAASGFPNFQALADDPVKVVNVDLEDLEIGTVVVSGSGMPVQLAIPFDSEENLRDWTNHTLSEGLPVDPADTSNYPYPEYIQQT